MDDPESKEEESESLVSWMLMFGRETLISVSCAQVGLPPLVVFSSSVGVAFAVFYASYACTTNILTFLLPIPPPYNNILQTNQHHHGIFEDAIFRTTEEHPIHLNAQQHERSITNTNLDNVQDFDGTSDDQGYEEDIVGEYLEGDANVLHEERKVKEPLVETRNDKNKSNTHEVDEHAKLRDQGWVGNTVEDDNVGGGSASNVDVGDVRDVETIKPVIVKEIDSHKLVDVRNKNEEQLSEMHHTVILGDGNNLNSSELDPVREVIGDADKDERIIKFDEQVVAESCLSKDGSEDAILMSMEHLIHSNAKTRVIGVERSTNNNLEKFKDTCFDGAGDDQGYEEYVGEYVEGDANVLHEEWKAKEPLVESWNDKNESNTPEVDEHAMLRDQGWVGNTTDDDGVVGGSASNVDFGYVRDVETTKPVTVKEIESHKLVEVGNKNEEQLSEMHHTVILCDENNLNSSEVCTLDLVAREVIGDAEKGERTTKFDEQVVERSCPSKDRSEDDILRTMEEYLIHSNAEARAIGDERSTDNNLGSLEGYAEDDAGEDDGLEEAQKGKQPFWNNEDAKLRADPVKDDHVAVSGTSSDVVLGDVETTKPVTVKHADSQKPIEVGNKNEEHVRHTLDLAARDADKDERTIRFDEPVVTKSSASTDGSEDTVLRTIEERLIHSVEDARAIGDERKNNNLESLEVGCEVKENDDVDDNVDALARSPPSDSEHNIDNGDDDFLARSPSKHDTVNAKVVYKKIPSREEHLHVDDEKIWEKIRAMKTIVGYDAPSQSTCIGELKALYVFTGVEPPASFEGDSDLDAKLKFLMAIVGVK